MTNEKARKAAEKHADEVEAWRGSNRANTVCDFLAGWNEAREERGGEVLELDVSDLDPSDVAAVFAHFEPGDTVEIDGPVESSGRIPYAVRRPGGKTKTAGVTAVGCYPLGQLRVYDRARRLAMKATRGDERADSDVRHWQRKYEQTLAELRSKEAELERAVELRDQARDVCVRRTQERDTVLGQPDLAQVLSEVSLERRNQNKKWGSSFAHIPSFPPLYDAVPSHMAHLFKMPTEDQARGLYEHLKASGQHSFTAVLVEEVAEVIATCAEDEARTREELLQVAAVAVKWIEAIDTRAKENNKETTNEQQSKQP